MARIKSLAYAAAKLNRKKRLFPEIMSRAGVYLFPLWHWQVLSRTGGTH